MTSFNIIFYGVSAAKLKKLADYAATLGVSNLEYSALSEADVILEIDETVLLNLFRDAKRGLTRDQVIRILDNKGIGGVRSALESLVAKQKLWIIGDSYHLVHPPLL